MECDLGEFLCFVGGGGADPEGLLAAMDEESVRDLFAYLGQKQQVPMHITAVNANDFAPANELRNWRADAGWKWESGEVVARGGAKPIALTSEMLLGEGRLSAELKFSGSGAAELVLDGVRGADGFRGESLSLGGPSAMNVWTYPGPASKPLAKAFGEGWHAIVIERTSESLTVRIDGAVVYEKKGTLKKVAPSFLLMGEGSELRVKGLRAEAKP